MDKIKFGSLERHLFMIRESLKFAAKIAREKHGPHGPSPIYKSNPACKRHENER